MIFRARKLTTFLAALSLPLSASIKAQPSVSFEQDIRPIFETRCIVCHNSENTQGGLSLTHHSALMQGGKSGPVVVTGHPAKSLLVDLVSGIDPMMPKIGNPITENQVALIRQWISEGAANDGARDIPLKTNTWWSFRPLAVKSIPSVSSPWVRTDIDRFILAKLTENGLSPSPEADRRTLIRRLTYNLHGLPPTPEEVEAFVTNDSKDAYEKLVDRLLASPHYGERWGRHWLDVVHYGESHGYDKDKARRHSWPYRDWVIRAFNQDIPYRDFVEHQLAGDVLMPNSPDGIISTGFIAAGPWDYVGHAELREGTKDKKIARLLDRDDMLAATMSTFVSLTVHCARCHDHKFDPIKQTDYYSLQAVFAGVDRAELPFDDDIATYQQRQALWKERQQIQMAMQPLMQRAKTITNPSIEALDNQIEKLGQESDDLLPKVGEIEQEDTRIRQEEIQEKQKKLRTKKQALVRDSMDDSDRKQLVNLEAQLRKNDTEFDKLPKPRWVYTAANYFKTHGRFTPAWKPRPVHLLRRGNVEAPGDRMLPGSISAIQELPSKFDIPEKSEEGSRRLALAKWITNAANPLTWRSVVNRVWYYHFGRGLVDTPNDFGRMGDAPTHPELLDWLAVWFRDTGGSLKNLHRMIVSSAVYRQTSSHTENSRTLDASNQFLWRMNRRRLDAESMRDTILAVSGQLDSTMGGPSDEHFFFKDDHSPVYDYARFDIKSPKARRRSIYRFLVRSVQDPFMESLDCADPSLLVDKRSSTLTAIQALALLNDPIIIEQSEHLAARLMAHSSDVHQQIDYAYRLVLARPPSKEELNLLSDYVNRRGVANLARLIFNSNEFLFVD